MYYDLSVYRELRKINPSESTLNRTAKDKQNKANLYFDKIVKDVDKNNLQMNHKPYQCDVKLK